MYTYLICFCRSGESSFDLIELPSLWRLLLWLALHCYNCRRIHILRFEEGEINERH